MSTKAYYCLLIVSKNSAESKPTNINKIQQMPTTYAQISVREGSEQIWRTLRYIEHHWALSSTIFRYFNKTHQMSNKFKLGQNHLKSMVWDNLKHEMAHMFLKDWFSPIALICSLAGRCICHWSVWVWSYLARWWNSSIKWVHIQKWWEMFEIPGFIFYVCSEPSDTLCILLPWTLKKKVLKFFHGFPN